MPIGSAPLGSVVVNFNASKTARRISSRVAKPSPWISSTLRGWFAAAGKSCLESVGALNFLAALATSLADACFWPRSCGCMNAPAHQDQGSAPPRRCGLCGRRKPLQPVGPASPDPIAFDLDFEADAARHIQYFRISFRFKSEMRCRGHPPRQPNRNRFMTFAIIAKTWHPKCLALGADAEFACILNHKGVLRVMFFVKYAAALKRWIAPRTAWPHRILDLAGQAQGLGLEFERVAPTCCLGHLFLGRHGSPPLRNLLA